MNLKLRNTLISFGALTLIGIAAAGLVVSIQTHKEAQKDNDAKEMLSREEIRAVINDGWAIYNNIPDEKRRETQSKELVDALVAFQSKWAFYGWPDEENFDDNDKVLEPRLEHLQEEIDQMHVTTMPLSTEDIRAIVNEGWGILINIPDAQKSDTNSVALKDALRTFESKWAEKDWPDEALIKTDAQLNRAFEQLKAMLNLMYNPAMLDQK